MKTITIDTVLHRNQRYPTVGDWLVRGGQPVEIRVSRMSDSNFEFLVAIHELIEAWLCTRRGIDQASVDQFDRMFEHEREAGLHTVSDECGDDIRAPYWKEHQIATRIEKMLARELGVDWRTYSREVESL